MLFVKHLLHPRGLRRYRFLEPGTRAHVLLRVLYLAVNIFYSTLGGSTVNELGNRTGTLSLINIILA